VIVDFNGQLGYRVQFAKFITIGVVIASFHCSGCKECKYPQTFGWFSAINPRFNYGKPLCYNCHFPCICFVAMIFGKPHLFNFLKNGFY
jgi:hypothetical protein